MDRTGNFLKYKYRKDFISYLKLPKYIHIFFLIILLIQISIGALVSGLDAGQIYQTWPLMNSSYFPDDSDIKILLSSDLTRDTRIMFTRNIMERVSKVMPFLKLDSDPYLVIDNEKNQLHFEENIWKFCHSGVCEENLSFSKILRFFF